MTELHPDLRAALASVSRALTGLGRSLRAIDQHQQREAGAQEERDERTEKLVEALNSTLNALPGRIEAAVAAGVRTALLEREPGPVERAKQDLAVEVLSTPRALLVWLKRTPGKALVWLAADRVRTLALLTALGGLLLQIADGAPFLAAIGRVLIGLGGVPVPSAGGAP